MTDKALFFFNGHAAVVAHMLVRAREGIENSGLAAVGIARNGEPQGIGQAADERAGIASTHPDGCGKGFRHAVRSCHRRTGTAGVAQFEWN